MDGDRFELLGRIAPPFTLEDQRRGSIQVRPGDGAPWLLSFHPLAWTDPCRAQVEALEARQDEFARLGVRALAISVDSWISKRAWAAAIRVERTPLLADFWPHGAVARQFGLFREKNGFSERANVLLDGSGRIIFARVYPIHDPPPLDPVFTALSRALSP